MKVSEIVEMLGAAGYQAVGERGNSTYRAVVFEKVGFPRWVISY